jgi:hypothetical protein
LGSQQQPVFQGRLAGLQSRVIRQHDQPQEEEDEEEEGEEEEEEEEEKEEEEEEEEEEEGEGEEDQPEYWQEDWWDEDGMPDYYTGPKIAQVSSDPESPYYLLVHTGTRYNRGVHHLMNSVNAWWNRPIQRWRIRRSMFADVKEGLREIGFTCPEKPPAARGS